MAEKLVSFYQQAEHIGGRKGRMRLAVLTVVPAVQAKSEPDSPENIAKFEKALQEIKKEFQ